ncbi:hypothetical protein BKA67DRAFT_661123 [Truncatella angustata]|uniref:Amidase domain-containing protein n=1 Tax=Truncatella angustata TaxID=152316 RepID=A0A9P8ZVX5_9PEZI|nr:uncharacterized protein BKA67DRAFT_661123 [Truncatella angustata]KAH6652381.1 hypothetical protein BKA67DRAFT_661123 [Truncatella angustata]
MIPDDDAIHSDIFATSSYEKGEGGRIAVPSKLYIQKPRTSMSKYTDLTRCWIVGKTEYSTFAKPETPLCHCIDYSLPWKPRDDGYQGLSGSSSGANASAIGYDWLDITVCTSARILQVLAY